MTKMTTNSGRVVDLARPDPDTISIDDIAHHLSQINRFNGATDIPYSVAQHSLWCSRAVRPDTPQAQLCALMHDAPEAYLGDVILPLKGLLPEYRRLEDNMWRVIARKYGLPEELPACVKQVDRLAYIAERRLLLTAISMEDDGLHPASQYGAPMPPEPLRVRRASDVAQAFVSVFNELCEACYG